MQAAVGDRIIVRSRHVGMAERRGEIVAVRGDGGAPPWVVRWTGDDHEALIYPGADATIEHRSTTSGADRAQTGSAGGGAKPCRMVFSVTTRDSTNCNR